MQAFYNAEQDGRDINAAGNEAKKGEGLRTDQYARALKRLQDDGLPEVKVFGGWNRPEAMMARPIRLTRQGVMYVEAKERAGSNCPLN
jgi:hypothetical protein